MTILATKLHAMHPILTEEEWDQCIVVIKSGSKRAMATWLFKHPRAFQLITMVRELVEMTQ